MSTGTVQPHKSRLIGEIFTDDEIREAFELLKAAGFNATPELVNELVEKIVSGPRGYEIEASHGGAFTSDFLGWALIHAVATGLTIPPEGPSLVRLDLRPVHCFHPNSLLPEKEA